MGSCGAFRAYVSISRKGEKKDIENDLYLGAEDDIYYENDNSCRDQFVVTQEFIDSLSPGDVISLVADGRSEDCGYGGDDEDEDDEEDEDE